jgi:predicted AlkP superfamily pyrophosphatase or phosphodiesterase
MPSVTNANNASICCGVLPEQHGITGNSYFDERAGREEYWTPPICSWRRRCFSAWLLARRHRRGYIALA